MEIYEKLDGICPFEVIRIEDTIPWGWDPAGCAYFEDWSWSVGATGVSTLSNGPNANEETPPISMSVLEDDPKKVRL